MSPRTDQYLSLCLSEASKSPLHYRHGCVIVAGGKVIGKGFNHYRPGFCGNTLKTGQLSKASALNGAAISSLKQKTKQKCKQQEFRREEDNSICTSTLSVMPALTGCKNGNAAGWTPNTPLSMHSEMMAIHSALSTSSTRSSVGRSSVRCLEKPCFQLSGGSKRKDKLREYVRAVCEEQAAIVEGRSYRASTCVGKWQVQESRFEAPTHQFCQGEKWQLQKWEQGGE